MKTAAAIIGAFVCLLLLIRWFRKPRRPRVVARVIVNPTGPSDVDRLLKRATELKKQGDIDRAIATLRQAYAAIARTQTVYSVDTFLRLPAYLGQAGRNDEAWREFNALLAEGYPNESRDPDLLPMDHSKIYDKMRLFLQRTGQAEQAVSYGVLSFASWQIGLRRQGADKRELATLQDVKDVVTGLLKKAKREAETDKLARNVWNELKRPDLRRLGKRVTTQLADSHKKN